MGHKEKAIFFHFFFVVWWSALSPLLDLSREAGFLLMAMLQRKIGVKRKPVLDVRIAIGPKNLRTTV